MSETLVYPTTPITRKQRKLARKAIIEDHMNGLNGRTGLTMKELKPVTTNQKVVFDAFYCGKNLFLSGLAGTGKTYISLALSIEDILRRCCTQDKVIIMRSAVPTRDMGFLPGPPREKTKVFEEPYRAICSELFGRGDAYDVLKGKQLIQFSTTSFIRGITISDAIIIIDEIQNMHASEINSLITRVGVNSRVILCGDMRQTDLVYTKERSGMGDILKIIKRMESFELVEFDRDDIVRSKFVKEYLIARDDLEKLNEVTPLGVI